MKWILIALSIVSHAQTQTFWFSIGPGGSKPMGPVTIAGQNQEYVVQGHTTTFNAYTIDWNAGSATEVNEISTVSDAGLTDNARLQSAWSYNVVLASQKVARFNSQAGGAANSELYPFPADTGKNWANPQNAHRTDYVFLGTLDFTAGNEKFYRIHSDRITDFKEFSTGDNSRAFGVLFGSTNILISLSNSDKRSIYDYTNGYIGGTDSFLTQHTKSTGSTEELGFISPNDARGYYVVVAKTTKMAYTVKESDGSGRLFQNLSPQGAVN